jgi:hypothetical protein
MILPSGRKRGTYQGTGATWLTAAAIVRLGGAGVNANEEPLGVDAGMIR